MNNVYEAPTRTVRVIGNNLLVKVHETPTHTQGGLLLPGNAAEHVVNTGEVVAVGFVTAARCEFHTPIPGVKVGDYVAFIRYLAEQDSNKKLQEVIGEDLIRIRPSDVMLIADTVEDLLKLRPDWGASVQLS